MDANHSALMDKIVEKLKSVYDPEIPVNLYDLGLIYSIKNSNNDILIEMTLTNPNCPVAGQMPENVAKSIEQYLDDLFVNMDISNHCQILQITVHLAQTP